MAVSPLRKKNLNDMFIFWFYNHIYVGISNKSFVWVCKKISRTISRSW